jgi:hypothetical protein
MWPILNEVHHELLPLHEEWVGGIKLQPTSIYGVRVNRNGSALAMHYDKVSAACLRLNGYYMQQVDMARIVLFSLWSFSAACPHCSVCPASSIDTVCCLTALCAIAATSYC